MFKRTSLLIVCGLILMQATSCTVIGYKMGARRDRSNVRMTTVELDKARKLKPGTEVTFELKDSTGIEGTFQGVIEASEQEYCGAILSTDSLAEDSPLPGDTVRAGLTTNAVIEGRFVAYDTMSQETVRRGISNSAAGQFVPVVCRVDDPKRPVPAEIPLNLLESLERSDGRTFDCSVLRTRAHNRSLPLLRNGKELHIRLSDSFEFYPIEATREIRIREASNARWYGLAIGAAVDAVWITAMIVDIKRNGLIWTTDH